MVLVTSLGLMGASLAAALARAGWTVRLHHRRPEVAREAERRGWGQAVDDLAHGARGCDLAVVAAPVEAIPGLIRQVCAADPHLTATDVGSVKGSICADLADLSAAGRFVGSHPMCGSHSQGLAHADPDLYRNAVVAITPHPLAPATRIIQVEELWRAAGARCLRLDPVRHDAAVAEASHLPHILACAAAAGLGEAGLPLAASGFCDTTRVAAGSPDLWTGILAENAAAVRAALHRCRESLDHLDQTLASGDRAALRAWLEQGRQGRERFERRDG
jgi:prephenate dehydrogenase